MRAFLQRGPTSGMMDFEAQLQGGGTTCKLDYQKIRLLRYQTGALNLLGGQENWKLGLVGRGRTHRSDQ